MRLVISCLWVVAASVYDVRATPLRTCVIEAAREKRSNILTVSYQNTKSIYLLVPVGKMCMQKLRRCHPTTFRFSISHSAFLIHKLIYRLRSKWSATEQTKMQRCANCPRALIANANRIDFSLLVCAPAHYCRPASSWVMTTSSSFAAIQCCPCPYLHLHLRATHVSSPVNTFCFVRDKFCCCGCVLLLFAAKLFGRSNERTDNLMHLNGHRYDWNYGRYAVCAPRIINNNL